MRNKYVQFLWRLRSPTEWKEVHYISLNYFKVSIANELWTSQVLSILWLYLGPDGLFCSQMFGRHPRDGGCFRGVERRALGKRAITTGWFGWISARTVTCMQTSVLLGLYLD